MTIVVTRWESFYSLIGKMAPKIGIIDTGIDETHPWLNGAVKGGIAIGNPEETNSSNSTGYNDLFGHGTSVASVVQTFCPEAELYAIRISRLVHGFAQVEVKEEDIARGIDWCLDQGISIINVSYAVDPVGGENGIVARACERAFESGAIVVASYRNRDDSVVYPASLPTVIGVKRNRNLKPGELRILDAANRDVAAWGGPTSVASKGGSAATLCGSSFSAPLVSAMIGRMHCVDMSIDLERAFRLLVMFSQGGSNTHGTSRREVAALT